MKRTSSSEYNFDPKRFETCSSVSPYYHPQQTHTSQIRPPLPHMVQQFQAQQDLQYKVHQAQQQQQQQYAAVSQQFYSQTSYFPMNQINYPTYPPAQNSQWSFLSTPPPPFFEMTPPPSVNSSQPPLPPLEQTSQKPPLPNEPEPPNGDCAIGNKSYQSTDTGGAIMYNRHLMPPRNLNGGCTDAGSTNGSSPQMNGVPANGPLPPGRSYNSICNDGNSAINGASLSVRNFNGICGPRPLLSPLRTRGTNGYNRGGRGGNRGRGRRNVNFFSQQQGPPTPFLQRITGDINDLAYPFDEEQPAGPEKMTIYLGNTEGGKVQVSKKAKRKSMSTRYTKTKMWTREDAEAAIALEREFNQAQKRQMLILKFPDPDLNKFIVKKYSPSIEAVHFQQPSTPRYCFVQLKENADVEKVINHLRQIPFGNGKISAELKNQHIDDQQVTPEEIDPYTLYIGNLPTHISVKLVKEYFPNAQRIDIGYAQRMRYTRYAFIRYNSVQEAMDSYRNTVHSLLDSRSLIVRFRRQKGNIGLPGETKSNAPLREGRAILPGIQPKPLEKDGDIEIVHDEVDDLEEDEKDDDDFTEMGNETEILSKTQKKNRKKRENDQLTKDSSIQSEPQVNSAEDDSKKVELDEAIDRKDKVLEEVNDFINKSGNNVNIEVIDTTSFEVKTNSKPERNRILVEGDIKLEQSDYDSSDDGGVNLLGTRVKDEPYVDHNRPPTPNLEDIYLDDYEYDDYDGEPEEDDDEWAATTIFPNAPTDWDEFRRKELNSQENKPDLSQLGTQLPVASVPSSASAIIEPKKEIEDLFPSTRPNKSKNSLSDKDDLNDMFAQLNSDTECEDEDSFFG